jgi:hypothetical protein
MEWTLLYVYWVVELWKVALCDCATHQRIREQRH